MSRVKICGLTRPEDVEASIRYGADYLGFIVEAKSKRRLSFGDAAKLSLPAKGIIPRVAVTVNMDEAMLGDLVALMQPDYIQFHGDESPEHIATVSTRYDVKTIKALPISSRDDLLTAMAYSGYVDLMLYDAKPPKNDDVRGGHGVSFDWSILSGAPLPKTWLLAGGLNPDNIGKALKTGAPILDVSSGVESEPGVKDHGKIRSFVSRVRFENKIEI